MAKLKAVFFGGYNTDNILKDKAFDVFGVESEVIVKTLPKDMTKVDIYDEFLSYRLNNIKDDNILNFVPHLTTSLKDRVDENTIFIFDIHGFFKFIL